jgi:hypothetical protein
MEHNKIELKYYIFDWDDNILHMDTKINMEEFVNTKWELVKVATNDFTNARNSPKFRLPQKDNKDDYDFAFENFRDNDVEFLKDCITAINSGNVGPSYLPFKKCLIEGRLLGLVTARGHNPDAIRKGVSYFIEHELTANEKKIMRLNLAKFHIMFEGKVEVGIDLIEDYLDKCDFIGVSSDFFIESVEDHEVPFGITFSPQNPELSKQIAVERFVTKCHKFSDSNPKFKVKIGFSDDDKGNLKAISELFSQRLRDKYKDIKFVLYDTSKNDDGSKNYTKTVV